MRRNILLIGLMLSAVMLVVTSCKNSNDQVIGDIEGTYVGSFSKSTSLKAALLDGNGEHDGIAEVTMMGENQIQVHCFGNEIDSTIMLDYFEHNDSIMVCLIGDDFESTYGHMLGEGHMSGGMMGDMSSGETQWMHHMNDEHDEGDEHFGGFDMGDSSFSYSFRMMDGSTPYYLKFYGVKE
jgi:hypothetical protein